MYPKKGGGLCGGKVAEKLRESPSGCYLAHRREPVRKGTCNWI